MADPLTSLTVPAQVIGGRIAHKPLDGRAVNRWLAANEGKPIKVTLGRSVKRRSQCQNRYYWGCVLAVISEETGHTTEELHEVFKQLYLPREYIQVGGIEREVCKSTTKLTTVQMEQFLDAVRAFSASQLGLVIPLPNED